MYVKPHIRPIHSTWSLTTPPPSVVNVNAGNVNQGPSVRPSRPQTSDLRPQTQHSTNSATANSTTTTTTTTTTPASIHTQHAQDSSGNTNHQPPTTNFFPLSRHTYTVLQRRKHGWPVVLYTITSMLQLLVHPSTPLIPRYFLRRHCLQHLHKISQHSQTNERTNERTNKRTNE